MKAEEIDWTKLWKKWLKEGTIWGDRGGIPEFWDGIVDGYEIFVQQCGRADVYLSKIRAEPDSTVLDIGAGPGTLAIPLAKK